MGGLFSRPLILGAGALAAAVAAFFVFNGLPSEGAGLDIETAEAQVSDIRRTVSTSGAVAAIATVEVGSQVTGQIASLNADYNSVVHAGDVMAQIDPQTFETRVRDAELALQSAQAQALLQNASLERAQAELRWARNEFNRNTELFNRGTLSEAGYEQAQAAMESAEISVISAETQVQNAEISVGQREAALDSARIDLERTIIRAPIDGTVLSRLVDEGQTVSAAQSAPTLFVIVGDLGRIQIDAQVDESDIGTVEVGQEVTFTVDAYSERTFTGEVVQKRLEPKNESNIVTYTVVIQAANPRQMLLPGMTANLDIITGARQGVLTVDNRALRFEPRGPAETLLTADGREMLERSRQQSQPNFGGGFRGGFGGGGGGFGGGNGFRGGGERNGGNPMVDQLRSELDLTEEQAQRVQAAVQSVFQSMQQSFGAGGPGGAGGGQPDREAMQARMQEAITAVLTPEQAEKFSQMENQMFGGGRGGRRVTVWVVDSDGRLAPRQVMLGVSDTAVTEIVGGDIEEGDELVIRVRENFS